MEKKYIDSEKLIAEIERRIVNGQDGYGGNLKALIPFITSLQQEQPEVDLEKEYDAEFWQDPVFRKLVNRNAGIAIAKYFYELGLKARKEE